ncbi:1253_t:CDS:1 [Ambispora leptoticha]|uniref:1253_t:CDS:1 n=1 Tax=Ambispora leptoticha TaxID=144679 RepID=A0A9N9HA54_9GLOM|nr:1253_t:CDS:1 [Ambispora leptoticha]
MNNPAPTSQHDQSTNSPLAFPPWRLSPMLKKLLHQFETKILFDHPHIPCYYCSILMYQSSTQWITYDPNEDYTLSVAFPDIPVYLRHFTNKPSKIAICRSCKNPKTRRFSPVLSYVPREISLVPMKHRKYLSPIHMTCSLGRTPGSNLYTTYRFLRGDFFLSKNLHALELFSGMISAFLDQNEPARWYHKTLPITSNWLKMNNLIFRQYMLLPNITSPSPSNPSPIPLPLARQSQENTNTVLLRNNSTIPDLVIPNNAFPPEIHNEDLRYKRLMAGFMNLGDLMLPISYGDPDLEAMIFPDLFSTGKGHYENICSQLDLHSSTESYRKYIKLSDPRFRLHWYWPHWLYLNLEKKRNFQYNCRLLNQKSIS